MKKYIDVALPQTPEALRAYADLLEGLSGQPDCCDAECAPAHTTGEADTALTMVDPIRVTEVPAPASVPVVTIPPTPEPAAAVPPPATAVPAPEPVAAPALGMASPDLSTLDSAGLPWDGRIHAATKTMMKGDGTWKKKRNSDPAEVEQVTAELRAVILHATQSAAPAAPVPAAAAPVAVPPAPPAAPAAAVPPAPPAPAAPEAMTFPALVAEVTNKQNMGLITPEEVTAAAQAHDIPAFPVLASKPELIPAVYADLVRIWSARTAS